MGGGGDYGQVVHWSGTRWEERRIGAERDVLAISGSSKDDVWAGTIDEELARWDGVAWRGQSVPPFESMVASVESLAVLAPDDVWLASGRDLYRWDGQRWTQLTTGLRVNKVVVAKGRILAAGTKLDNVTPAASELRGNQWKPLEVGSSSIGGFSLDDRGRLWIGTDRGDVLRLDQ
jgi:hypothetical protein